MMRMCLKRRAFLKIQKKRTDAVNLIARNFREYRRFNVIPKILKKRKNENATVIQKFLKGYQTYHKLNR